MASKSHTIKVTMLGTARNLQDAFEGAAAKAERVGARMESVGRGMTTAITLPLAAAGVAAFRLASDADEAMSQTGQIFGDEAQRVIEASENMNDAFSQVDFLGFASNAGDILQGLGMAREETDDMALSILGLSQDLASFKNKDPEQVFNAMTSALTGEREALKGVGIVINDAMVKQRAMEMGLWDGVGALDQVAQAQATYALLTEKSANAIGDFDRTADGAANKTRTLRANFIDTAATLGQHLLPIGTKLLDWATDMVGKFNHLSPAAQENIVQFAGVAAAVGPVLIVGGKLVQAFSQVGKAFSALSKLVMANPWVLIIAGTILLVTVIVQNWDKISAFLRKTWDWIKDTAAKVGDWLKEKFQAAFEFVKNIFLNFTGPGLLIKHWDSIKEGVSNVRTWIQEKLKAAMDFVKNLFLNWTGPGLIIKHWDTIKQAADGVRSWIVDKFTAIMDFFRGLPDRIKGHLSGLAQKIKDPFVDAFAAIERLWNDTIGRISFKVPEWVPGVGGNSWTAPKLHGGGIYHAPTPGGEGFALLRDGEAVLSPGQTRRSLQGTAAPQQVARVGGGQQTTINLTVNALDPASAAKAVVEALQSYARANGGVPLQIRAV
jgi:hypothetical protein